MDQQGLSLINTEANIKITSVKYHTSLRVIVNVILLYNLQIIELTKLNFEKNVTLEILFGIFCIVQNSFWVKHQSH